MMSHRYVEDTPAPAVEKGQHDEAEEAWKEYRTRVLTDRHSGIHAIRQLRKREFLAGYHAGREAHRG